MQPLIDEEVDLNETAGNYYHNFGRCQGSNVDLYASVLVTEIVIKEASQRLFVHKRVFWDQIVSSTSPTYNYKPTQLVQLML